MRYLLIAVSILAALLLGLLVSPLLTPRPKPIEGLLVINQRIYQPQELEKRLRATPYHFNSRGELITNLIYQELLLQESKKQGIDNENEFLLSMRNFYEQSMIKTLLDRQYKDPVHDPNSAQIASCQPFLDKTFTLQRFDYPSYEAARSNTATDSEEFNLPYLDLPEDTRSALLNLKGGELSQPLLTGSSWFRLQLIDISQRPTSTIPSVVEQEELCRIELKRQSIQNWVDDLYRKSTIELPAELKERGNG